ncbi:MAG: L-serine ammonia-lyase, iron-sulfur-dependent, subunit alpha [Tissierella sp.]|uniref:L-serine ammonia-lyase, iron-sulfur-dependent, subunit alpha n=1 Tax=Tissierella sp. TaxID=41274 RepID=UPI003F98B18D
MFNRAEEILQKCKEENKSISDVIIEKEMESFGLTYEKLIEKMRESLEVMKLSANAGLEKEVKSVSGLTGGNAKKIEDYKNKGKTLAGNFINSAMAKAFSTAEVNASMGKIVASPTAGASGIIPSAFLSVKEKLDLSDEDLIKGLFTSAGIGEIIAKNSTISGAEGGCQAECGAAAAMAAGALVEMAGGDPEDSFNASSFALTNIMGLVCDPVAGLVEYPCALRNSSGVVNAITSADMALAKVQSLVPFDEVVDAMSKVGKSMPAALRETAMGGLAATPTGKMCSKKILG